MRWLFIIWLLSSAALTWDVGYSGNIDTTKFKATIVGDSSQVVVWSSPQVLDAIELYVVDTIGWMVDTLDYDPNRQFSMYDGMIVGEYLLPKPAEQSVRKVEFWILRTPVTEETVLRKIKLRPSERTLGGNLQIRKVYKPLPSCVRVPVLDSIRCDTLRMR